MKYSVCSTGNQKLLKLAREPCNYEEEDVPNERIDSMIQRYMGKNVTSPAKKKSSSKNEMRLKLDAGRMI